jgi:hypothetical protein
MNEEFCEFFSLVQKLKSGLRVYFCARRSTDQAVCVLTMEFVPGELGLSSIDWGNLQRHAVEVFFDNISENVFFWERDAPSAVKRHVEEFGDL